MPPKRKTPLAAADANSAPAAKRLSTDAAKGVVEGLASTAAPKDLKYSNAEVSKDITPPKTIQIGWSADDEDEEPVNEEEVNFDEVTDKDREKAALIVARRSNRTWSNSMPLAKRLLTYNDDRTVHDDYPELNEEGKPAKNRTLNQWLAIAGLPVPPVPETAKAKAAKAEACPGVTKEGFMVTEAGTEMYNKYIEEFSKRDQDSHGMYIYNDWTGYGVTELMENIMAGFNEVVFKKDVDPLKKWAHVEGLALFVTMGPVQEWMMNDDSESVQEILDFYGSFLLTALDILQEANLLSPTSPVPNIEIITLLILDFVETHVTDVSYSVDWSHEVVRFMDKAEIEMKSRTDLSMGCVKLSKAKIDSLRNAYKAREARSKKKGIPARDWKKEYAKFKRQGHTGGTQYDITKMSAAEKKKHSFGS